MKNYIYIDNAVYPEQMILRYSKLSNKTQGFTNFDGFTQANDGILDNYIDSHTSRIIYNQKSYIVVKNFIDIESNTQFIILQEG